MDLDAARAEGEKACGLRLDDQQLASYLLYPKVTQQYFEDRRLYSDTSVLPTPVFFYGLREQEELVVDIDPGKTLMVTLQSRQLAGGGERLQFELNGQARMVNVPVADASGPIAKLDKRPIAESGNPLHLGAPMPGTVVSLTVTPGQKLQAGTPLLTLEAMKMEAQIVADREGTIDQLLVRLGDQVAAKELLLTWCEQ